ncbi:SubName: Full=Uncharacterized protein {ECO:0000313/EMBL:CCA67933.1} [Serendipita indica DSM 11827]|nr:SubName: Full=Uncharacterized protein {ECO:0000313/EMBL:CCA67933.1} [Serendipita indica DSM 11827]
MITSTLKRSASVAFLPEQPVAQASTSSPCQPTQQLLNSITRKSTLPCRSPSLRRTCPRSQLRRSRTLDSFEHLQAGAAYASPRPLKRQRTEPSQTISLDDWQIVSASDGDTDALFPAARTTPKPIADPLILSSSILSATCRFISSFVSTRLSPPAPASVDLPHVPQPPDAFDVADLEMEEDTDDAEEDITMIDVEDDVFPPSPFPEYTAEQWSRLSRYPHLVDKVMSGRVANGRAQHKHFVACNYAKEANPYFNPPKPRQSSPLAPIRQKREPYASNKMSLSFTTDRAVRSAQRDSKQSRLLNYPTCSDKYPGPDRSGSILRNTVLLNFGDWLRASGLWISVQVTGIHSALAWYETYGCEEEGTITPDLNSPTATDLAGLTEAHFA